MRWAYPNAGVVQIMSALLGFQSELEAKSGEKEPQVGQHQRGAWTANGATQLSERPCFKTFSGLRRASTGGDACDILRTSLAITQLTVIGEINRQSVHAFKQVLCIV